MVFVRMWKVPVFVLDPVLAFRPLMEYNTQLSS